MIRCDTCPRCKDEYPDKVDAYGNHFHICGMTGNMVYTEPRREKRYSGPGYIKFGISGCGLFDTVDAALAHMTEIERKKILRKDESECLTWKIISGWPCGPARTDMTGC